MTETTDIDRHNVKTKRRIHHRLISKSRNKARNKKTVERDVLAGNLESAPLWVRRNEQLHQNHEESKNTNIKKTRQRYPCVICNLPDLQSREAYDQHCLGRRHLRKVGKTPPQRRGFLPPAAMHFIQGLCLGSFKNIVVCTGDGIGSSNAKPMFVFCNESGLTGLEVLVARQTPSKAHVLCALLYKLGWLRRVYTTTTDDFHLHDGYLPEEFLIRCGGQEAQSATFQQAIKTDFCLNSPDLVIVLGSHLREIPFCAIPNLCRPGTIRVLVHQFPNVKDPPGLASATVLGKRRVTVRSLWNNEVLQKKDQKYANLVLHMSCDQFAELVLPMY